MDTNDLTLTPAQLKKRETTEAVSAFVQSRWGDAVSARSSVTEQMVKVGRALRGEPISGQYLIPELQITYNIIASIHRGIVALITDAFAATTESLFVITATTVPTLEQYVMDDLKRKTLEMVQSDAQTLGVQPSEDEVVALFEDLVYEVTEAAKAKAQDAAKSLGDDIKDSFEENGWGEAITQAVYDFIAYPAMVMKAPAPVYKKKKVWVDGVMRVTKEVTQGIERIAPFNFYTSPNAQDVETADYLFELRTVSANELVALTEDPAYDSDEIIRALTDHKSGFSLQVTANDSKLFTHPQGGSGNAGVGFYDVQCFYGKVMGSHLTNLGIEGADQSRQYDAEIFLIG